MSTRLVTTAVLAFVLGAAVVLASLALLSGGHHRHDNRNLPPWEQHQVPPWEQ